MEKKLIVVNGICYSYVQNKKVKILNDLNFEIEKGEFVSVLGRSGCGKTTLTNIIAGYIKPTSGEILINNTIVNKPGKNRIVVNQENDLFGWMTVRENMRLVSKNEENINKYLKLVGLGHIEQDFPNSLSGGMKKRLSLARALVVNPEFLILDEPFSSLDYSTKQSLHVELAKLFTTTKKTILLVTHTIEEAIFLSDRIIILGGKPTSIIKIIKVDFSRPRKLSIKKTKKFNNLKNVIESSYK